MNQHQASHQQQLVSQHHNLFSQMHPASISLVGAGSGRSDSSTDLEQQQQQHLQRQDQQQATPFAGAQEQQSLVALGTGQLVSSSASSENGVTGQGSPADGGNRGALGEYMTVIKFCLELSRLGCHSFAR